MHKSHYSILLIDDSEDDYLYIRTLLEGAEQVSFNLTWINTAAEGIAVLGQSEPIDQDLFLLNCDLEGEEKGLDLLKISGINLRRKLPYGADPSLQGFQPIYQSILFRLTLVALYYFNQQY